MQFSNYSLPTSSSIQFNSKKGYSRIGKHMDMVNGEDKGCEKPLYENNLTITLAFRLEMTKEWKVPKKSLQNQKCPGRERGYRSLLLPKNP